MSERNPPPDPNESTSLLGPDLRPSAGTSDDRSDEAAGGSSGEKAPENSPAEEDEVEAAARQLVGTVIAERYRIERLLGAGAMGAVYRAEHVHMQKAVALKVLHRQMSQNTEVVRRFEREAIAAGRIDHPNVAGASDFGRLADGSFYLVLEFINGKSLGQLMEEVGAMPPERACHISIQVAAALAAAHKEGIVHRDLKPDNVMMPASEEQPDMVKVLDFGMAKMQQADTSETKLTMHGAVYGTPQYMAPEQAAGQDVDHRADLYALGLMLYEMLSGQPPFSADSMMALLIKHMTEKPPALPAAVPRPLSKLVLRCLQKEPAARPQTADEIIESLSEFLGSGYQDPRRSVLGLGTPGAPRPAMPSVVAMRSQVAARVAPLVEKAEPLVERARPHWEKVVKAAEPGLAWLQESVSVKGRSVPRWWLAAGAFGFLLTLLVLWPSPAEDDIPSMVPTPSPDGAEESEPPPPRVVNDPSPPDPELARVIRAAEGGSQPALYALKQRQDEERSLTEWLGLAKGQLRWKEVEPALDAFGHAIELDKSAAYDKELLSGLRRLADQEEYARPILDFAAQRLGGVGADFLFHVWAKTSLKTTATTIAYELLTSGRVEQNYSPALQIAMDIREAASCEEFLALLPRVERQGDDRTLTKLRELHKERGCGSSERDDCYPCLRKGDALNDATQAAGMRKSPQFAERRFRFKK